MYDFDVIHNRKGTGCVKWDGMEAEFLREDVIPMWIADSEFPAPAPVVEAVCARARQGVYGYGLRGAEFENSLTGWVRERHGWEIDPGWVRFSPGIVPALSASVAAFTEPGDGVLVQSPVYTPFYNVIRNNGRRVVSSDLALKDGRFEIDWDDLERKFSSGIRLFLFCSPHNPSGRVWTEGELLRVAGLCLEHGVTVVSDDIHCDIVYPGSVYKPLCAAAPELRDMCVTCFSPSKTFNVAGLSSSGIVIPGEKLRDAFGRAMAALETGGGNIFGNLAFAECYGRGGAYVDELLPYLLANRDFAAAKLGPPAEAIVPEGTFLMLVRFAALPHRGDDLRLFFAREAGVMLQSGAIYGRSIDDCLRLNFACARPQLAEAVGRMASALKKYGCE